jgi:uncharacterized membrane protein YfcA
MTILFFVKVALIILIACTLFVFIKDYLKTAREGRLEKTNFISLGIVGFITNFFDTLGIGSFAPTTALLKNFKLSADRTIPGTLNVSSSLPVFFQALIFITVIKVEPLTLIAMFTPATLGSILGAGFVSKLDENKVRVGLGSALLVISVAMLTDQLGLMPSGGTAIGLPAGKLALAAGVSVILGAFTTIGVGFYAPCMALVFALGMSPRVAFPIMMSSCAFLMPAASIRFIKKGAYDRKASLAIALFGTVAVFLAAYVVKSLPLHALKWLVIAVIIFTSVMMFRSALDKPKNFKG